MFTATLVAQLVSRPHYSQTIATKEAPASTMNVVNVVVPSTTTGLETVRTAAALEAAEDDDAVPVVLEVVELEELEVFEEVVPVSGEFEVPLIGVWELPGPFSVPAPLPVVGTTVILPLGIVLGSPVVIPEITA